MVIMELGGFFTQETAVQAGLEICNDTSLCFIDCPFYSFQLFSEQDLEIKK